MKYCKEEERERGVLFVGKKSVIKGSAAKLYKPDQYKKIKDAFEGAPSIDRQVFEIMKDRYKW